MTAKKQPAKTKVTGAESQAATTNPPPDVNDLYSTGNPAKDAKYFDPQNLNDMLFGETTRNGVTGIDLRELRNLADLIAATGYFGDLTPAQIAFQIMAGKELGFDPIASIYNLKISPGKIELAGSQPRFLVLADAVDFHRFVFGEKLTKRQTDEKANKGDLSAPNSQNALTDTPEPKTTSAAAKRENAPIICPQCLKQAPDLSYQSNFDKDIYFCSAVCSITATENYHASRRAESAAVKMEPKGDIPIPGETAADTSGRDVLIFPPGDQIMMTGTIDDKGVLNITNEIQEKEKSSLKPVLAKNPRNDVKTEIADPKATEIATEKVKVESGGVSVEIPTNPDDYPKVVKVWRKQIDAMLSDLAFAPDVITEKLKKFDGFLGIDHKRDYFVSVETHFDAKLAAVKRRVFDCMDDPAQFLSQPAARKEYFALCFLDADPAKWSYQDSLKLQASLEKDNILPTTK